MSDCTWVGWVQPGKKADVMRMDARADAQIDARGRIIFMGLR
jgi:hypothetical protein